MGSSLKIVFLIYFACSLFIQATSANTQLYISHQGYKSTNAIPWSSNEYHHFCQGEDLKNLLIHFIAQQGINGIINPNIKGNISGNFNHMAPQVFFDGMMAANGLVWFYDGNNLYIDPASEVKTQSLQLPYVSIERLVEATHALRYQASNWSISPIPIAGLIQISGPSKFVDKIAELAVTLNTGLTEKDTIRLFPLKYAWAQDTTIAYQGQTLTVPGIATQLQQLMFGQSTTTSNTNNNDKSASSTLSAANKVQTQKTPLTPLGNLPNAANPADDYNKSENNDKPTQGVPSSHANIQANVPLNAIIIRDSLGRMPIYEEAIALLDRPVPIIEITVSIVDVDTQYTRELGNQLFALSKTTGNKLFDFAVGPSGRSTDASTSSVSIGAANTVNPANIAFRGTVNAYKFAEAIRALEGNDHAKTLSRPSVLTLDNTEAVIDRQQTFYVQISSQYATNLFNVDAGTVLRVTPHYIEDGDQKKVKLLVKIQDGAINFSQPVNEMPTVSQSSVSTQAVVHEGQGLLIAGQYRQNHEKGESGIPFLSRIPIIGALFGTQTKTQSTAERMYLITPKLINLDDIPQEPYNQYFQPPERIQESPTVVTSTSYSTIGQPTAQ